MWANLRFPGDQEVIITDTVGFIKNLPKDLLTSFRATLEELEEADLLLHVIDVSHPRFLDQMLVVENLLEELKLSRIRILRVFNKVDLVSGEYAATQSARYQAIPICARQEATLRELLAAMEQTIQS
jgi:GTP-binding protein HflX